MVGQTRGPQRPNMAPSRTFHPGSSPPPPQQQQQQSPPDAAASTAATTVVAAVVAGTAASARTGTNLLSTNVTASAASSPTTTGGAASVAVAAVVAGTTTTATVAPSEPETIPDANYSESSETNIADDETMISSSTLESPAVQKTLTNSNPCYSNINNNNNSNNNNNNNINNQKTLDSKQTNVNKMLNSEVPQYVKKMPQIGNNQILSILPSGRTVDNVVKQQQPEKGENFVTVAGAAEATTATTTTTSSSSSSGTAGTAATSVVAAGGAGSVKRSENQPNFITMQQKINEKLLANQIPIQRLPEQQFILKQVGSSDNIVTMTTAKIPEPNQNYFAMLTNKPQPNYVNYLSLPVNQQNFIAVDQQQKNNYVVMEAQHKTNFVTVPQKPAAVPGSGQTYLVHGNGTDLKQFNSYLAVTTKPGETNGTTFFTMTPTKHASGPQTAYLMTPKQSENSRTFVAVTQKPAEATYLALPAGKAPENNKTATFIAMEPSKSDIIVTQVLPSSQQSPQLFQLEYAENEGGGKSGKYFNQRDASNAVVQPVVPKMSCSAIRSSNVSTKTVATSAMPPLTSVVNSMTPLKRSSTSTTKALTSPGKTNVPPPLAAASGNISFIATSGNVTFLSSPNVQSLAGSNIATLVTNSTSENRWDAAEAGDGGATAKTEAGQDAAKPASLPSPNVSSVPVNTVLNSNAPHSHQYLIPKVDNLKLAAESINKMIPAQVTNSPAASKPILKMNQADQNFQMHNYSKNDSYPNHASAKSNVHQESARRKYGQQQHHHQQQQHENNKISAKNSVKYSHGMYSNHQRSDKNQNYGSFKSRIVESRPTNHQRMNESKSKMEAMKSYSNKADVKKEIKMEELTAEVDIEDSKFKKEEDDDEEEGVEVRPVFDMRIPLVFQVVLTDHCYGMPMLLLRDEKPLPVEDDKESVISSDGKGEEGEETETAPEGEDSITRCICDMEHDDGYMVCCDKCSVWQHVACVFPDVRPGTTLPEEYLCDACHPRKLDRNRARALQLQRRKQIFNNSDSSDSSSSSLEIAPRASAGPKKTVARRRAEPVPRKINKLGKPEPVHNDTAVKNVVSKARRRDSTVKTPVSTVGRRTKLKKKLEAKMRQPLRRKSKNKETPTKQEKESSSSTQRDRSERSETTEDSSRKSPDLRTRLQMLKSTSPRELNVKPISRVRCRVSHLPQGETSLVTTCNLARGQLIVEIRGKFLLSDEQPGKSECLFFYKFPKDGSEIVVDASGYDNLARYARRSCRPNSQLKHCIVKGSLRLYIIASEDMGKNQEVTIAHNSINDTSAQKEGCVCRNKDCPFAVQKNSQNTSAVERRRRGRRRTVSEESEGTPVKNRKEPSVKVQPEPARRNSSMTHSSRSPSSPVQSEPRVDRDKDRKLTRDERKIEQAMKIFAQMERDTARKKDKDRPHVPMSGSSGRRDSHLNSKAADSDKESPVESNKPRRRRRRKRRRSRKVRLPSGASAGAMTQFNSGDSDLSSGDEILSPRRKTSKDSREDDLQSPVEKMMSPRADRMTRRDSSTSSSREKEKANDAAGLLLALGGRYLPGQKTPTREKESENEGSPPTPLSSACLLVAAAVGPLAPGFRFPKTKKGLMNEWLSKSPEHPTQTQDFSPNTEVPPATAQSESTLPPGAPKLSNLSNRLFFPVVDNKSLELKVDPVKDPRLVFDGRLPSGTPAGFGKKRWLRQAISEECDAPHGQGSPPCPPDNVTPLKKRRLARESLSSDPPTTPPMPPLAPQARDEPIYSGEVNSPESPTIIDTETEISLAERVDALRREYLEAQKRNLLKSYDGYENENQQRHGEEAENYERYNSYDSSPQRVPENLSYNKYPDSEYYQETNQTAEKPLDLTGEKDEKLELSDSNAEGDKNDSSPKGFRKSRARKPGGKNEVRTSPRFRKTGKNRRGENGNLDSKDDDVKMSWTTDDSEKVEAEASFKEEQDAETETELQSNIEIVELNVKQEENDVVEEIKLESKDQSELVAVQEEVENITKSESFLEKIENEPEMKIEEPEKILQNGLTAAELEEKANEETRIKIESILTGESYGNEASESQPESRIDDMENFMANPGDKSAPIKRKLSITEYLKRKKCVSSTTNKSSGGGMTQILEEGGVMPSPSETHSPQPSPPSDDDPARIVLPTPSFPLFLEVEKTMEKPGSGVRFKSEPTELERQRENLTERLRREFGLLISDDEPKPVKSETEDTTPPPPPPMCPYPVYHSETNDYLDAMSKRSFYHPPTQTLPQSAIYPVGSSNPPNPSCVFTTPYPPLPPPIDEKRKDKKMKKFKQ